ncbi:hypothetical protein [Amycolatopsis sp. WGS_07]|uniref:hypothetical protein n=1 Tax=Amycolatopsis sp. WGS_07 TaxID=3076764 RepID=UPI0038737CF6
MPENDRVTAYVPASGPPELAAGLAELAGLLSAQPWRAGGPEGDPIALDAETLAGYLTAVETDWANGVPSPCLLASGDLVLVADFPPDGPANVWFPLLSRPAIDGLLDLLGDVVTALGAYHAHVENDRLLMLYQAVRATERARAAAPEEYRHLIPDPPGQAGSGAVPSLLVPQEYDTRRVPPGVWWANYWDARQVRTLGENRVHAARWARLRPAGQGLLLAPTEEPLDPSRADHAALLRELVEGLGLPAAQERFRFGEDR